MPGAEPPTGGVCRGRHRPAPGSPLCSAGRGEPGMKATAGAQGTGAGLPAPRREGPPPPTEGSPPAGRERPSVTAAEGEGEAAWSHLVIPVYRRETCGLVTLNARRPNLLPGDTESRPPHSGPPRLRPLPITTSTVGPSAPAPAGGRFRPQSHEGEERGRP